MAIDEREMANKFGYIVARITLYRRLLWLCKRRCTGRRSRDNTRGVVSVVVALTLVA
jgi:hypothetical protein